MQLFDCINIRNHLVSENYFSIFPKISFNVLLKLLILFYLVMFRMERGEKFIRKLREVYCHLSVIIKVRSYNFLKIGLVKQVGPPPPFTLISCPLYS